MLMRYRSLLLFSIALPTWACSAGPQAALNESTRRSLGLKDCYLDGVPEDVRCGSLEVYEDRDRQSGKRIQVQVAVLPALVRDPEPDPLVILAGGPGQGARSYAPIVHRYFQRIRRTRDIVLLDLRGTGDSAPLKCPMPRGALALEAPTESPAQSAQRCLAALDGNPKFYTHPYALADLHDVLQQLGYGRVNLWGGSWGSRSALVFAAMYPDTVRSVVLDGAVDAAFGFPWSYGPSARSALDRLFEDCHRDPACDRVFPAARREVEEWLTTLERRPLNATVRHPRMAQDVPVTLDRATATELIRVALYSPLDTSRLLMVIRRAAARDLGPLAATAERASSRTVETMAVGQTISILCSEEVGSHPAPAVDQSGIFGTYAADAWTARCAAWPKGRAPELTPQTKLAMPALILSGALDPVTPPARGVAMRRHFPNSLHIVAPGAGHNVSFSGCLPRLIADFIAQGGGQALDTGCAATISRPAFVTSLAGGRP